MIRKGYSVRKSSEQKPSLCIITDYMVVGGVEKVICEAVEYLSGFFSITVVTMFGSISPEIRMILQNYVTIKEYNLKSCGMLALQIPMLGGYYLRAILRERFDVLLVVKSMFIMAAYGSIGDRTIYWNHGDKDTVYADCKNLSFRKKINKLRLRIGYTQFDDIWVVNEPIKDKLQKAFGLKKVHVLENPVDCAKIMLKAEEPVYDITFDKDCCNIVSVSRLTEEKAQIRLIYAVEQLSGNKNCRLVLVGDGPCRKDLEKYVRDKQLDQVVSFVGTKENPYPYMKSADIFVLPSQMESFGLVALEAMLLNIPVIVTDTTGGRFVTENGTYGSLVENSTEGIAEGVQRLLDEGVVFQTKLDAAKTHAMKFDKYEFRNKIRGLLELKSANT